MATAEQLSRTYSFIGPLLADTVLAKYGDNALPLFAIALHLDVEDLASFATESLTDHSADKKANVIYISEADGVVCVAQGQTAKNWGKRGRTFQQGDRFEYSGCMVTQNSHRIRTQAQLLRDGLQ